MQDVRCFMSCDLRLCIGFLGLDVYKLYSFRIFVACDGYKLLVQTEAIIGI